MYTGSNFCLGVNNQINQERLIVIVVEIGNDSGRGLESGRSHVVSKGVSVNGWMNVCVCIHVRTCACAHACERASVCVCICMWARSRACVCVCTCVRVLVYIWIKSGNDDLDPAWLFLRVLPIFDSFLFPLPLFSFRVLSPRFINSYLYILLSLSSLAFSFGIQTAACSPIIFLSTSYFIPVWIPSLISTFFIIVLPFCIIYCGSLYHSFAFRSSFLSCLLSSLSLVCFVPFIPFIHLFFFLFYSCAFVLWSYPPPRPPWLGGGSRGCPWRWKYGGFYFDVFIYLFIYFSWITVRFIVWCVCAWR